MGVRPGAFPWSSLYAQNVEEGWCRGGGSRDESQLCSPSTLNTSNTKNPVSGDLGVHSGEELQLTTTITHVDGPTEIYKLTRKDAQE